MLGAGQQPRSRTQSLKGFLDLCRHKKKKKLLMAMIHIPKLENCLRDVAHWSYEGLGRGMGWFHTVISCALHNNTDTTGETQGRQPLHS